jgi:hypothetical protein
MGRLCLIFAFIVQCVVNCASHCVCSGGWRVLFQMLNISKKVESLTISTVEPLTI